MKIEQRIKEAVKQHVDSQQSKEPIALHYFAKNKDKLMLASFLISGLILFLGINYWQNQQMLKSIERKLTPYSPMQLNTKQLNNEQLNTEQLNINSQKTLSNNASSSAQQFQAKATQINLLERELPVPPKIPNPTKTNASLAVKSVDAHQFNNINEFTGTNKQVTKEQNSEYLTPKAHQEINATLSDITSGKVKHLSINWPTKHKAQVELTQFLYQCAGVTFGTIKKEQVFLVPNYSKASAKEYSQWLRLINGPLQPYEQRWMKQYQLVGKPIRVFPQTIDYTLATYIWQYLQHTNQSMLNKFYGQYKLQNNQLLLQNIVINDVSIQQSWEIFTTSCVAAHT